MERKEEGEEREGAVEEGEQEERGTGEGETNSTRTFKQMRKT